MWIKEKAQHPTEMTNNIKPNWLRVDIATIFLKSFSKLAQIPEITIVNNDTILKKIVVQKIKNIMITNDNINTSCN